MRWENVERVPLCVRRGSYRTMYLKQVQCLLSSFHVLEAHEQSLPPKYSNQAVCVVQNTEESS